MKLLILAGASMLLASCQSSSTNLGSISSILNPYAEPSYQGTDVARAGIEPEGAHSHQLTVGTVGTASMATRTVEVVMRETEDGEMLFEPALVAVKRGETVRFKIANKGEYDHEFVLGDHHGLMEHKALMEKFPEMEHDDPNSLQLEAGMAGEIIWTFTNDGAFEFACLVPGHYDLGMKGAVQVAAL